MKELRDVAFVYKTLAQTYITNGPWKPAYRTGNLYNRVGSYNTPNNMIKQTGDDRYELSLNFAPDGASYGFFVHQGTSKMEARPFAQKASEDATLKNAIDKFFQSEVNTIGGEQFKIIDTTLRGAFQ
jgi:hypothetical protein